MKRSIYIPIIVAVLTFTSCKKDDQTPDQGRNDGKKIEEAVTGKKYKVAGITDQTGADASSKFPSCFQDDRLLIKTTSSIEITQGTEKCGSHATDVVNVSWGIGYGENSVNSIFFPVFETGSTTYKEKEFTKGFFNVNTDTGEIQLIYKVDVNTYTIRLIQTL